jgi:hypothetical protein
VKVTGAERGTFFNSIQLVMNYLQELPFTYKALGKINEETYKFYKVEFTRDFGIYVKGDKYDNVEVDADSGELRAYEEDHEDGNPRKAYTGEHQVALQSIAIIMVPVADK